MAEAARRSLYLMSRAFWSRFGRWVKQEGVTGRQGGRTASRVALRLENLEERAVPSGGSGRSPGGGGSIDSSGKGGGHSGSSQPTALVETVTPRTFKIDDTPP